MPTAPFDTSNAFSVPIGTTKSIPVQTLKKPPEGERAFFVQVDVTPSLTVVPLRIEVPQWNSNTQVGLSQLCAIGIDLRNIVPPAALYSLQPLTVYFPDTQESLVIEIGSYVIFPVHTAGLTFYLRVPISFPVGSLYVQCFNFFQPGMFLPPPVAGVALEYIGSTPISNAGVGLPVDLRLIGGSSANIANGRVPVDIQAQTLTPLTVKDAPFANVSQTRTVPAAAGVTSARLVTGVGVIKHMFIWIEAFVAGGVGSAIQLGFLIDGGAIYPDKILSLGAGVTFINSSIVDVSGLAIAFAASVDLYINVFGGALAAGSVLEGGVAG